MQTKRLFIAAEFPAEVVASLSQIVREQWPQQINGVKWVNKNQYHLTLKFLGDTSMDQIPAITQVCKENTNSEFNFPMDIKGFGVFPNQQSPTVLWAGIHGADQLIQYQNKLDKALNRLNIPLERRAFKPHLTLARIKDYFPRTQLVSFLAPLTSGSQIVDISTQITAITLFESELTRQGPIYKKIWTQNNH
jgi:RNA 2',3'-cyclic 3'-phosphodiesterase